MRPVVVDIFGGLGNQMFQYAAAKSLAERLGVRLELDVSMFSGDPLRAFSLGEFAITDHVRGKSRSSLLVRFARSLGFGSSSKCVEPFFHYWEGINEIEAPVHMHGYWQSEKYFKAYEDLIRRTFSFSACEGVASSGKYAGVSSPMSVSVHLRRGDYKEQKNVVVHGILGREYYDAAYSIIKQGCPSACFFVFTDAINEAVDFFSHWNDVLFVDGNNQYQDMYLMSQCRHHIIANSSYSWWGAWLGAFSDGMTVAPKMWFAYDVLKEKSIKDLFPEDWIVL
uniref:Glycosyl transferase family 11 n=1 Tax=Nitratidesulfovibrio vulgaris (strain DSM 19637 / Miyazaki F) TaxID=883 RepID=B8DIX7_NITV9